MKNLQDLVAEVAEEVGGRVLKYSGRGMMGKTCPGIACYSETECIEAAASRGLKGATVDALGKAMVVYWKAGMS
jgi:hypothetical protein